MDYRNDSDKIGCFISEELIQCKGSNISGSEVYELYEKWCDSNGFGTESSRSFYTELRAKNLLSEYGTVKGKTVKNVLKGYCIKDEQSEIIEYVETKVLPFK